MGDIFSVDYSSCADANREVNSNINYIDAIIDSIDDMDESTSEVSSEVWDSSTYDQNVTDLRKYLGEERERYSNFHSSFENFYSKIEELDKTLKALFENEVNYIENEGSYELYLAIIETDISENLENTTFEELIALGLSEEEAMKVTQLCSSEMMEKINELSSMSEEEIKSYIDSINGKENKSAVEIILCDILSLNSGSSYLDMLATIADDISEGKWDTVIFNKYLKKETIEKMQSSSGVIQEQIEALQSEIDSGNLTKIKCERNMKKIEKLKNKQENMIKSNFDKKIAKYGGKINKLKAKIRSGKCTPEQKAAYMSKIEQFKVLKENSVSNSIKVQKIKKVTTSSAKFILNAAQLAVAVWQGLEIGVEQANAIMKYGKEVDDAVVDGAIDIAAIGAGMWAGGKAGALIGTSGSIPGTILGFVVGCVVGGLVTWGFECGLKPKIKEVYDDYVEPAIDWVEDKCNDIGDWWDTLWW